MVYGLKLRHYFDFALFTLSLIKFSEKTAKIRYAVNIDTYWPRFPETFSRVSLVFYKLASRYIHWHLLAVNWLYFCSLYVIVV